MENKIDHDDIGYNDTPNEHFSEVLDKAHQPPQPAARFGSIGHLRDDGFGPP
ncbi:hypothetical protein [Massilia eburnea]|uniref:hypothetical protein n=1 Tax=Massilia eburnea TaxID=1776165 RepID=UPI003D6B5AB6